MAHRDELQHKPTDSAVPTGPEEQARSSLRATRIVLRPIATPFPLGFLGLAGATLTVSGVELGWIPSNQRTQAALIVMIFAPTLQLIACLFGFLGRDPVAATGMGVLAVSWELIGLSLLVSAPGSHSVALGTLLAVAAIAMLMNASTAVISKIVPAVVMGVAGLRFLATALYELIGTSPLKTAAGVIGCVLAALAVYAAAALEIEGVLHRAVLPVFRRGPGHARFAPDLSEQVGQLATEAGVRAGL